MAESLDDLVGDAAFIPPVPCWAILDSTVRIDDAFANRELSDGKPVFLVFTDEDAAASFAETDGRGNDEPVAVSTDDQLAEIMEFMLQKGVLYVVVNPAPGNINQNAAVKRIEEVVRILRAN